MRISAIREKECCTRRVIRELNNREKRIVGGLILTEAGELVGIRGINYIHESLQLKLASCSVLVVVEHCELEGGLYLVGTLLKNGT